MRILTLSETCGVAGWAPWRILAGPRAGMRTSLAPMRTGERAAVHALQQAVAARTTPGGVLAAGRGAEVELLEAVGWAETGERSRPMTPDTLFDLASLTKVVATLPVALRLLAEGALALETPVVDVLPAFAGGSAGRSAVTLEHLLTHTAGLPAHREYWRLGLSPAALRDRLLSEPLEAPPGSRACYSDLGFLALGWIAEAVAGRPLDALVADWVAAPLGLRRTGYGPRAEEDVAATEAGPGGRRRVGTVHDETAAALGAPAGHAGVFAPAGELGAYLAAWLASGEDWLPRELRDAATRDRTSGLGGHRGLGWAARHDRYDQLGDAWPETAVFHSGFTGTSLALDPPSGRWVVLLTNDVHFGRERGFINPLRRAVHTALAP